MNSPIAPITPERDVVAEIRDADTPPCFPSHRMFGVWRIRAVMSPPALNAKWCEDCLPSYQLGMCSLGLCDRPEIGFEIVDGGFVGVDQRDQHGSGGARPHIHQEKEPLLTPEIANLASFAFFKPLPQDDDEDAHEEAVLA